MGISVKRDDFVYELSLASSVASSRTTMPVLGTVLLQAEKGALRCVASDLQIDVVSTIEAECGDIRGSVAISAKRMFEIVKSLPENECHLEMGPADLRIRSGRSKYRLIGHKGETFPKIASYEAVEFRKMQSDMLSLLLKKVLFSVSTNESQVNLNGVYVDKLDGKLVFVSTDGHRLTKVEQGIDFDIDFDQGIVIPRKGVAEIRKVLERYKGECEVGIEKTENRFFVRCGKTVMGCKLLGEKNKFPDYRNILPGEGRMKMIVHREKMVELLRRVSLMTPTVGSGVKISIVPGKLVVECENPGLGNVEDEVDIEYDGPEFVAGYNPKYLIDIASEMEGEKVLFDFDGELDPAILRQMTGVPDDYVGVVMPLRL